MPSRACLTSDPAPQISVQLSRRDECFLAALNDEIRCIDLDIRNPEDLNQHSKEEPCLKKGCYFVQGFSLMVIAIAFPPLSNIYPDALRVALETEVVVRVGVVTEVGYLEGWMYRVRRKREVIHVSYKLDRKP